MLSAAPVPSATAKSDSELIKSAIDGDSAAFTALHDKYKNLVMAQLVGMNKSSKQPREFLEDVSQDVWSKVYEGLARIDKPDSFRPWLQKIVSNLFLNSLKRNRSKTQHIPIGADGRTKDDDSGPGIFAELTVPPERWVKSDLEQIRTRLEAAFNELSPKQRALLELKNDTDLNNKEIAKAMNMPETTVRRTLHYIREQFKGHFPDLLDLR